MRKLPSLEKLLKEWESQEAPPKFEYVSIPYTKEEFDNVPPIVPRFLMHLQQNLRPIAKYLQEDL